MNNYPAPFSDRHLARCKTACVGLAVFAAAIGGAALLGWVLNVDFLKRIHPALVTMKVNTAVCLILTGFAVLLLQERAAPTWMRRVAQSCAALVGIVGLLTLSQHLFSWDSGIDQLLFKESAEEAGLSFPGRMGVAASVNFGLLGMALLLLGTGARRWLRLADTAVQVVVAVTLLVFLYYFYGIERHEPIAFYFTIALHTVIAFLSLCAAILLARPERGIVVTLLGNSPGSIVARRMLPVLLVVVFLGWIRTLTRDEGWLGSGFATAAFVLAILFILGGLIWWTAVSLNRTDRDRRLANQAMRDSESRLTALLEQLPVGIGLTDRNGRFVIKNSLLNRFAGDQVSSVDPVLSLRWRAWMDGRLLNPDEWPSAIALRGEVSPGREMIYTNDDGTEIWTRVLCVPFRDERDELDGVIVVIQDIDEHRRAEKERERLLESEKEARDAAEKANQLKDEFLATLSHELRNPLNVILGYSELLLRLKEIEESPRLRQIGDALRRNAQAQSQLINDLLDLSRLQRGKISLNQETVSLSAIIDNAVETVRGDASVKGVAIRLNVNDQFLLVDGDRLRLQQIAWNILNNAVKFTPAGGKIDISLSRERENAVVEVADTGQGIEPSFFPHLFEMFRQADGSNKRRHGGMGIGLALVQQLVQLHGGTISAASEGTNKGSRFTVRLPLTREPETLAPSNLPASAQRKLGVLVHAEVLVVDDSEDTIAMLEQLLKLSGANVTTASNGTDALLIASEKDFDLILSDISMPEMDGYEFLQRLRRIEAQKKVPVIAITGFGRAGDIERARSAGFFAHLTKPLNLEVLADVLGAIGNGRASSAPKSNG